MCAGVARIEASDLAGRLAGLLEIGGTPTGYNRLAWTEQDRAAGEWFAAQASEIGARLERDPAGNLWAVPAAEGPWWAVGSHLDTVRDGGAYDGALGVAAGFEIAKRCRRPLAVIACADEEGARFNTPTFGSRCLVGRVEVQGTLRRRDEDGVTLRQALAVAGLDGDRLADAQSWLGRLRGFLELHIDQSRALALAGAPAGAVSALASRTRMAVELRGQADHAGTTLRAERRDALAAAAQLIVCAERIAPAEEDFLLTCTRLLVQPNALTTIPALVRLWLDVRAGEPETIAAWRERLERQRARLSDERQVEIELLVESESPGVEFDRDVRAALSKAAVAAGHALPQMRCFAGHDAGVLAERIPAGMVLVRNRSGISHDAAEMVSLDDAAIGANVLLDALAQER